MILYEKTTALGGVATGSINAKEQDIVPMNASQMFCFVVFCLEVGHRSTICHTTGSWQYQVS